MANDLMWVYYNRELGHLRGTARQFAEAYPKVAARLALTDDPPCPDPYIERLLEGFAYLSARVQLKLDSEFPRFTQNLMGVVYPHYLAPMPSATIVQFRPNPTETALATGHRIPRGSVLRSDADRGDRGEARTPCEFRTSHDLTLWPITVADARYFTSDIELLQLREFNAERQRRLRERHRPTRSALRLRLRTTAGLPFNKLTMESLDLFIRGEDRVARRLYQLLFASAQGLIARPVPPADRNKSLPPEWEVVLGPDAIAPLGFDERDALLPYDARSCQAYRLIREYFAFPQRFMFARLVGLLAACRRCEGQELDLIIPLDAEELALEGGLVSADNFVPGCSPAVNLFPRRAAPIFPTDRAAEHRVVVDPKAPFDHEVFSVTAAVGYGQRPEDERDFRPFYAASDFDDGARRGAYFATYRAPRAQSETEQSRGPRTRKYRGSEVYVSLVDGAAAPYPETIKQLDLEVLCTNRDLPVHIDVSESKPSHLTAVAGGPIAAVRCVVRPTFPRPSPLEARFDDRGNMLESEGQAAWRGVSHLSLNYLSMTDADEQSGAAGLRDLLRLYADTNSPAELNQIKGVRSVKVEPVTRQALTPGPVTFVRGLLVTVTVEPTLFEDAGVFLFGAVVEQFFARYVTMNSVTEMVLRTTDGKEIKRWATRLGHRPMI